jgi:hypothetical protein
LVRHSKGSSPASYAATRTPVDQAGARRGIGEGGHHDELVGVGDDDPLVRVVVIGGST